MTRLKFPTPKRRSKRLVDPTEIAYNGKIKLDKPVIQHLEYGEGYFKETDLDKVEDIPETSSQNHKAWITISGLHDVGFLRSVTDKFKLDRLVIRDIIDVDQRPKIQENNGCIVMTLNSFLPSDELFGYEVEHLTFVVGKDYLLCFQEGMQGHFEHIKKRLETHVGIAPAKGTDFLFYLLIEAIIKNYFDCTARTEGILDTIGESISANGFKSAVKPEAIQNISKFNDSLALLKFNIRPVRDDLNAILLSHADWVSEENRQFYFDLKDQAQQLIENIEYFKTKLEGYLNLFFNLQSYFMNQVMKTLTVVSTIFIPLTFLAGIYGMNFEFMPELHFRMGYFWVLGAMAFMSISMLVFFKTRNWF